MAASNANNWRNSNRPPQVSSTFYNPPSTPFYPEMTQSPAYQSPSVNPPQQMMFRAPIPHYNQRMYGAPTPHYNHMGFQPPGPHYNHGHVGNPRGPQGGPRGDFNHLYPPGTSRGGNFRSPHIGSFPHHNHARGGHRYNISTNVRNTYPNSGRGRGGSQGNTMGRGSGTRRKGTQISAEEQPDLFAKKTMLEDPWGKPVLWEQEARDSWLPASIRPKKSQSFSGRNFYQATDISTEPHGSPGCWVGGVRYMKHVFWVCS